MTNTTQIWHILKGIGWPTKLPEFDEPVYETAEWDHCQLIPGTTDGFTEPEALLQHESGPYPPLHDYTDHFYEGQEIDSPHCEDYSDPSHQDYPDPIYD